MIAKVDPGKISGIVIIFKSPTERSGFYDVDSQSIILLRFSETVIGAAVAALT